MRLLLLAVLALAAVALGATYEPQGGCDCDFGAGNGTAYLVVNNPYNFTLSLDVIYGIGEERRASLLLNISTTRVVKFCGLGDGWLYIKQHISPLRSPLILYPLSVPRYLVLRAGESATIIAGTLFAPATAIAVAIFLLVAIALRPKLGKWAIYATPEPLRAMALWSFNRFILVISVIEMLLLLSLFFPVEPLSDILEIIRVGLSRFVGHVSDVSDNLIFELIALVAVYVIWSLGGFYLTFHKRECIYVYLSISFIISILLFFISRSLLFFLAIILSITSVLSSSIILISLYGVFMSFLLLVYGASIFIYYDVNFGLTVSWNLPFQIPAIGAEFWIITLPLLAVFIVYALLFTHRIFDVVAQLWSEDTVTFYPALLPPLWWWFGLGIFALGELTVRSFLHKLSTSGTIIVDLSRGGRAVIVSADLYGMYLCKYRGTTCDDVNWVRYGEVKFKVSSRIKEDARDMGIRDRFGRKVVLPIFASILALRVVEYTSIYTILSFISFLGVLLLIYYKYGDLREMKEYIRAITQDKGKIHMRIYTYLIFLALLTLYLLRISGFVTVSALIVIGDAIFTAIIVLILLRADPVLSRYRFPWLELRLMSVDSLAIGLARGGCLQWAKGGGAPRGRAFVIRDGDCLVVVSPYVDNVRSRLQRYLCGPACPPIRVVGVEGVAVGVLDLQKRRYYYYVVDSSR